jgi:hypothetical protein
VRALGWVAAIFIAAPMLLGPGLGGVLRAVGGEHEHTCACGMKPGTCGCPACARLEHERRAAKKVHAYPAVRTDCHDDDGVIVPHALPDFAAPIVAALPRAAGERRSVSSRRVSDPDEWLAPPATPPPRAAG